MMLNPLKSKYKKKPTVEIKPAETKQVPIKPVETKQVPTKPVETKPVETKPVPTKPVETKQVAKTEKVVPIEKIVIEEDDDDEDDDDDERVETKKEKKKRLEQEELAELVAKDDPREHLNIVFIGHVDAGKSTISGQVLLLTGMVDQRLIEKYTAEAAEKNRSSWYLAYIMDTNDEERAKGKTVEVGRAHFNTEKKRYTILDAPGHKNFVPQMIMGVAQADIAVLVISSRKGEFEAGFEKSGQTREHALLAKTLGVKKLIIVVNKMDDPTTLWKKERYDSIVEQIGKYLRLIGFGSNDTVYLPVSGYTGSNIKLPVSSDDCPWWKGSTLLDTLDSMQPLERMDELYLRIPLLDRYKESGKTILMGKIETGVLRTGDELICNPNNIKMVAQQIQNDEFLISVAKPGENVKLVVKVSTAEEEFITKGCVVAHLGHPAVVTTDIVAQIVIVQFPPNKKLFTAAYQCVLHLGTACEDIKVIRLLDHVDKQGNSIQKLPTHVIQNSIVIAHLNIAKPMCVEKYEDYAQLGRFTLRDEGVTIGFGKVLATNAPMAVKRTKK